MSGEVSQASFVRDPVTREITGIRYENQTLATLDPQDVAPLQALVSGGGETVAFSQTIDLTGALTVMAQVTVGAALTFTPSASPRLFGQCHARLVADGINAPDFSAFLEFGSSAGYDNTSGIINHVDFWFDGVTYWYAVQQAANAVPVTVPAISTATIPAANPNQIVLVFSTPLNPGELPAPGSFVITNSAGADTVTSVNISGSTLTLTKSRTTTGVDVATLAYTAPTSDPLVSLDGVAVGSFSGQALNNELALQFIRLSTLSNFTESGNASVGYTYTSTGANLGTVRANNANLALVGDGYIQAKISGSVAATGVFYLDDANTDVNYTESILGVQTNGAGSAYLVVRNNTANNAANGTATLAEVGDVIRIRRAGTTAYLEVSKDDGATFVIVHTLAGVTTAPLYAKLNGGPNTAAYGPIVGFGVA